MKKLILLAAALLAASPAAAQLQRRTFEAVATFTDGQVSPVRLQFGLTFDPAATNLTERPVDYFRSSLADPAFGGPVGFFNDRDAVVLGGVLNGVDSFDSGTNDFFLSFFLDPANGGALLDYVNATAPSDRYTFDVQVRQLSATAVPEPAGWAMAIAGFGLVGAAMRRRRGRAAPA